MLSSSVSFSFMNTFLYKLEYRSIHYYLAYVTAQLKSTQFMSRTQVACHKPFIHEKLHFYYWKIQCSVKRKYFPHIYWAFLKRDMAVEFFKHFSVALSTTSFKYFHYIGEKAYISTANISKTDNSQQQQMSECALNCPFKIWITLVLLRYNSLRRNTELFYLSWITKLLFSLVPLQSENDYRMCGGMRRKLPLPQPFYLCGSSLYTQTGHTWMHTKTQTYPFISTYFMNNKHIRMQYNLTQSELGGRCVGLHHPYTINYYEYVYVAILCPTHAVRLLDKSPSTRHVLCGSALRTKWWNAVITVKHTEVKTQTES